MAGETRRNGMMIYYSLLDSHILTIITQEVSMLGSDIIIFFLHLVVKFPLVLKNLLSDNISQPKFSLLSQSYFYMLYF